MLENLLPDRATVDRLRGGLFGPHLDSVVDTRCQLGYLHADLRLKEEALSRMTPLDVQPGRFRPDDKLLAFLEGL
jgi:hypothetical protein